MIRLLMLFHIDPNIKFRSYNDICYYSSTHKSSIVKNTLFLIVLRNVLISDILMRSAIINKSSYKLVLISQQLKRVRPMIVQKSIANPHHRKRFEQI